MDTHADIGCRVEPKVGNGVDCLEDLTSLTAKSDVDDGSWARAVSAGATAWVRNAIKAAMKR